MSLRLRLVATPLLTFYLPLTAANLLESWIYPKGMTNDLGIMYAANAECLWM